MQFQGIDLIFPKEYLRAALMVSLLSVWVLVGLFYYLNRYTKREYFTLWTAAWLFYALWLTLCLTTPNAGITSLPFQMRQFCVAISAVFLLWGSLNFLGLPTPQLLMGLFMLFVLVWTFISPQVFSNVMQIQLPVFILVGLGSVFAGSCFWRLRQKMPYVGAGMLSLGFFLWGLYLTTYPISQEYENLYSAGFFVAAVLQLFIAVSMIVLVLEEVRYNNEQVRAEIDAVRTEKEALQIKVITTEEQCRSLYDQVRLTEGIQKAYEELRRTQEAVVRQERLRALGQMASGVAHDINNALLPIIGYAEMMLDARPTSPEERQQYLEAILKAGEDVAGIVARMREFYRRRTETEHLKPVDISKVFEEVIAMSRPRWRDLPQRDGVQIQIKQQLEPDLPKLLTDPGELREALINLVFNAVDALPKGGTITLAARSAAVPNLEANGSPTRALQIEVRDDGVGMDERVRQRCLEPFFSTKTQRGGTGLGLAMVYGMMQRHEGNIDVASAPGRGTCILLTFPLREDKTLPAATSALPSPEKRSLNILCIDDEPQVRKLLQDCLGKLQHQVTVTANGKEGVEIFRETQHGKRPFEIVITDLGMPEMDGQQVARTIKAESPRTPVVLMTGWGTIIKEHGKTAPEVDALVAKPPRMRELNELLLRLAAAAGKKSADKTAA